MNLSVGIVGLANVGKSTLFNALRSAQGKLLQGKGAKTANYPFTTIEPNVGVVEVPDSRLQELARTVANEIFKSQASNNKQIPNTNAQNSKRDSIASLQNDKKGSQNDKGGDKNDIRGWVDGKPPVVPAVVKFVDIAGLVKGAHKGEGLGNQFLAHIREVDVIVFVVRDFKNPDIIKTGENPKEDQEVLRAELFLKDLETLEKRIDSLGRETKAVSGNDLRKAVLSTLEKAKAEVEKGNWLAETLTDEELEKIADLQLLSAKKTIIVVNSDEEDLKNPAPIEGALRICAKLEEELAALSDSEQKEYLKQLGIEESGLEMLIEKAYETLDLATFLTAGVKEVRAWTFKKGTLAPQAAGVIHSDFEKGFIAADIVPYDKFVEVGGWQRAQEKGLVKTIGKNERMPENVVVEFKFSV